MPPNEAATGPAKTAAPPPCAAPPAQLTPQRFARFYGNLRSRGNANRDREVKGRHEMLRRLRATDLPNEVVLIRPTKCASSGAASARTALSQRRALRPANTQKVSSSSWQLTMRLSDAGLRQRRTKALYPNHRLPPWPIEDATRDRSNRLLGPNLARQLNAYTINTRYDL